MIRTLPLQIEVESISPSPSADYIRIVQILLGNVGEKPVALPVGRLGDAALNPGNRDRHEFWFSLRVQESKQALIVTGAATYASADLPGSFLTLPPQGRCACVFPSVSRGPCTAGGRRGSGSSKCRAAASILRTKTMTEITSSTAPRQGTSRIGEFADLES